MKMEKPYREEGRNSSRWQLNTDLLDRPAVDELNEKTLTSVPMLLRTLLPLAEHSFSNL
jgi:hypothetical protein